MVFDFFYTFDSGKKQNQLIIPVTYRLKIIDDVVCKGIEKVAGEC